MGPKKKKASSAPPSTIQSKWFAKKAVLSVKDLELIRAESIEEAFDSLIGDSWNGGICSYLTVDISQNNQVPVSSNFVIKGPIFDNKEKAFKTSKFFNLGSPGYLVFANLDCSLFQFHNGLTSNYVDSSEIPFEYRLEKDSDSLPIEDVEGYPGFCLRASAYPTEANWVRLTILLFPKDVDALLDTCDSVTSPAWPGVTFASELIPLDPSPGDFFSGPSRGLPVVPALISEAPFTEEAFPSTTAIIASVSATLRAVTIPESKSNFSQLGPRWANIVSEGNNALKPGVPDLLWPEPAQPMEVPPGSQYPHFYLILLFLPRES